MTMRRSLQVFFFGLGVLACVRVACAQDAIAGRSVFAQCAACHAIDSNNGAGPGLQGVYGRKAGSYPGFRFSRAMKGADYSWDAKALDAYLADPQKAMPGNLMPFSGISDPRQRADLIAYLKMLM